MRTVAEWTDAELAEAIIVEYSPRLARQVNRRLEAFRALQDARARIAALESENGELRRALVDRYGVTVPDGWMVKVTLVRELAVKGEGREP